MRTSRVLVPNTTAPAGIGYGVHGFGISRQTSAVALVILFCAIGGLPGMAGTLTVCLPSCGYTSIQDAINQANDSDVIEIWSGQYNESVVIRGLNTKQAR
jgi:hypothetical protein